MVWLTSRLLRGRAAAGGEYACVLPDGCALGDSAYTGVRFSGPWGLLLAAAGGGEGRARPDGKRPRVRRHGGDGIGSASGGRAFVTGAGRRFHLPEKQRPGAHKRHARRGRGCAVSLQIENGDYVRTSGGTLLEIHGAAALLQRAAACILAEWGQFDYGKRLGSPLYRLSDTPGDEARRALAMAQKALRGLPAVKAESAVYDGGRCTITISCEGQTQQLEVEV